MRYATKADDHLNELTAYVINGCLSTRADISEDIQPYWAFQDVITAIFGIVVEGRRSLLPAALQ